MVKATHIVTVRYLISAENTDKSQLLIQLQKKWNELLGENLETVEFTPVKYESHKRELKEGLKP